MPSWVLWTSSISYLVNTRTHVCWAHTEAWSCCRKMHRVSVRRYRQFSSVHTDSYSHKLSQKVLVTYICTNTGYISSFGFDFTFFFLVITPVSLWPSAVQPSLYPFPLTYFVITDWFVSSRILYTNRITQYILFCVISLNIMILKCIHVVGYKLLHACSFPSVTRPVYGWLTFANPLTCWWRSGFFPLGRMMNKAARNIHIQDFLWTCFHFSWVNKYPGAEWVDGMFNFIRNYQFYKMTLPLHLPINSTQEFQLLHILVNP